MENYDYIRNLVLTNSYFKNYICYTKENITTCVFSDDDILFTDNTLNVSNADIYNISKIDTNYLTHYTLTGLLNVDDGSIIYSNIGSYASITADIEYIQSHNISYNLTANDFLLVLVLLIFPIVYNFLSHFFYIGGKK